MPLNGRLLRIASTTATIGLVVVQSLLFHFHFYFEHQPSQSVAHCAGVDAQHLHALQLDLDCVVCHLFLSPTDRQEVLHLPAPPVPQPQEAILGEAGRQDSFSGKFFAERAPPFYS